MNGGMLKEVCGSYGDYIEQPKIVRNCCAKDFDFLKLDSGLGVFHRYSSEALALTRERLKKTAQCARDALYAAVHDGTIIGYICCVKPGKNERWGHLDDPRIVEFGSIEISRNWRRSGLATRLLRASFGSGDYDDKIVFSQDFSWHWDVGGAELHKEAYAKMLLRLFGKVGFKRYWTDEPEIASDWASMLTVRVGKNAEKKLIDDFMALLFLDDFCGSGELKY